MNIRRMIENRELKLLNKILCVRTPVLLQKMLEVGSTTTTYISIMSKSTKNIVFIYYFIQGGS